MKYKIKSSPIERSWFEDAIFSTLAMYDRGDSLTYSPLAEFQRNYKTWGGRHRSLIGKDLEEGIKERLVEFISLYENFKDFGYKEDQPPLFVYFDDDGFIRLYDGHHRLSIIRYLGLDPEVWVSTDWDSKGIDPRGYKGRDFPLAETARSIWKGQKKLYHYVFNSRGRLSDFVSQRPDSTERRDWILSKMEKHYPNIGQKVPPTVLDIGCSEGYLSHELAKEGFDVTGIEYGYKGDRDRGRKLLAITRYLATIQNVKMNCILGDWKDLIRTRDWFDNILYLSVLHNEINALGADKAFENLRLFRGKCKRLFVEVPDITVQRDWTPHFELKKICTGLERETGMKVKEVWQGYRPIILLTNELRETSWSYSHRFRVSNKD